jgi:hypothetical protein
MNQEQHRVQLDERIVALLRKRNSLAPIASLPTEVLAEVFDVLRDMVYDTCKSEVPILCRVLTHTCQAWRSVATQYPRLWSVVDFHGNNAPWSLLMIARARSTPLSITVRDHFPLQEEEVMTQVAGCMATVRELSVQLNYKMSTTVQALFMSASAPILETLEAVPPANQWDQKPIFPLDGVFNGATPRLKTFIYSCADILWTPSIFLATSITSLNISINGEYITPFFARGRRHNFVAMLCTLRHLEELRFSSNTRQRGSLPPTRKAILPKLCVLELSAEPDLVASIMECIILPLKVRLRLEVRHSEVGSDLSNVIWQHCGALALQGSVAMHKVHFVGRNKVGDQKTWIMRAWHSKQEGDTETHPNGAAWLDITCKHSQMHGGVFLEQMVESFQRMFASTHDVLFALGPGGATVSSWFALLTALSAVTHFRMIGFNDSCFQALVQDAFKNGHLPLPVLKFITFYGTYFHGGEMVVPWLNTRKRLGSTIEAISLIKCTHGWTSVKEEAFREAVLSSVGQVMRWEMNEARQVWYLGP